jgi:hypothetical protein
MWVGAEVGRRGNAVIKTFGISYENDILGFASPLLALIFSFKNKKHNHQIPFCQVTDGNSLHRTEVKKEIYLPVYNQRPNSWT